MSTNIQDLGFEILKQIDKNGLQELIAYLQDDDNFKKAKNDLMILDKFMTKLRFADGVYCLHCGCPDHIGWGTTKQGYKRYKCSRCGRTYTACTKSIFSAAKLPFDKIMEYIESMFKGDTLRVSKENCKLSVRTCFFWRHKFLDCLTQTMKNEVSCENIA